MRRTMMLATFCALTVAAAKTPLYVVLRMDDVQAGGWRRDVQTSFIQWGLDNNIKLNLGMIAGVPQEAKNQWVKPLLPFPRECKWGKAPCAIPDLLATAFNNDQIRMKDKAVNAHHNPVLQLFNHAYDHEGWPCYPGKLNATDPSQMDKRCQAKRWADGTGKLGFTDMDWVNSDLDLSMDALNLAFPEADISTFVPPENLATVSVLNAVRKKGLDIVSTAASVRCNCPSTCCPDDKPALDNPDNPQCTPTAPYPLDCSTVNPNCTTTAPDPAVYTPKFPKFNYNYQPCQPLNIPPRLGPGIDPTTGELKVTPRICSEFIPPNCPAGACINSADGYACKDCADLEKADCTGPTAGGNDLCIWKSDGYTPPQCVNAYCIPPEDKYWKNETGFQKLDATAFDANLFSVPTGSANSLLSDDGIGLSPKQSFGEDTCGTNSCADTLGEICTLANASGDSTCSVVAAAKSAADRSDGIHWTVMMMHPQTMFDGYEQTTIAEDKAATPPRNCAKTKWGTCPYGCHLDADECWQHIMTGKGYASWMDDYLAESKQLKDFEVHFVHFSDLLDICSGQSRVLAVEQCAAWVQIYDATSGDAWAAKACGSSSSSSSSKFRTDPCSCAGGVICEDDTDDTQRKTITSIKLVSKGLTGMLPPSVSKLTNLRTFEVQGNTLNGKLPDLPKSLTTCKLLGSSPTNRFACPVCAGADKDECRANSNATCVATTTCTKDVAGVDTKLTTSDCDPCHSLSAIEIGGICLGAIVLMCLVNMKRTGRGPFASANGREREDNASLFEATAPILIDSEALLSNRPPSDEEEGVELPGGRGVEQTMGKVLVRSERPAERRTLGLQTSNVNKYSKGKMVFDMGKDKMCGIVTAVEATAAGRPAGTITVAVYETKVLPVESISQWPVGQRLEGEDSGIVAKSVPSAQGARAQFSSTQSAAMRSADPSNLVGQRLHVFDTEAGRLGTVTSVKSCKGGSSKHSIKFDEGDGEPELVSLQKTKGASKGVRFRLENAVEAQAGTVTIFLD